MESSAIKYAGFDVPAKVQTSRRTKRSTTKDGHRFTKLSAKEETLDPDFDEHVKAQPFRRTEQTTTKDRSRFADGEDYEVEGQFPDGEDDAHNGFHGPFRWNIRRFLTKYAFEMPAPQILQREGREPYLTAWSTVLEFGHAQATMHVVEEDVRRSRSVYCENCRVAGWGGHPVCRKRYHFIINNDSTILSSDQSCMYCGTLLSGLSCTSCNYTMTADDLDNRAYLKLHDSSHLLHGLLHINGYGHLLQVNGQEGGSQTLTGSDIVGFWDRLCMMLQVREVTVRDVSMKYGMDYRLLHAVATGRPWYGKWGYQFEGGSFAITLEDYHNSVDDLSNIPLSLFYSHARSPRTPLQNTIALYWSLSDSQILTLRDLFFFIMQLLHDAHGDQIVGDTIRKIPSEASRGVLCPWTRADVEQAEQALIKVLRAANGSQWVTWRALRGATCRAVESPELLDCCIKALGGRITHDGMVVAVRCNPETNCIEYRLEVDSEQMCSAKGVCRPTRDHLLRDLRFMYDALLNPATMQKYKPEARWESAVNSAVKILDCKQLVKHYDDAAPSLSKLRIWCNIQLVGQHEENSVPPPELLVLPINTTVASLKQEATKAFQETYLIFQQFEAEQLKGFENVGHSTSVALLLGLNGNINVSGRCLGVNRKLEHFRMERGMETWIVDCICGTIDDDGERMLACDSCGVWQHTRCNGIEDVKEVPETFVCMKCMIFNRSDPCSGGGGHDGYRRYNESISHEFVGKGKTVPPLTKTHTTFDEKSNKDEIASQERNCMHEMATMELICNDRSQFIMEGDTVVTERCHMDKIPVKEVIEDDEMTPSLVEADTMFFETNSKDEIDVPFHKTRVFMYMISVM